MENEAWSKIQLHENLELKNLMALYTLTLRTNLEHFLDSIVYVIYNFESWEVRSPMLQTVCKSKLKWRSYGHWKTIAPSWKAILQAVKSHSASCKISLFLRSWHFQLANFRRPYCKLQNPPEHSQIFATDSFRFFSSDICCLNPHFLLVIHQSKDSLVRK